MVHKSRVMLCQVVILAFTCFVIECLASTTVYSQAVLASDSTSSVRRVDGYRGIWFSLGQYYAPGKGKEPYAKASRQPVFPYGDKYSGGLGTYTAKHTPLAIYSKRANKTFFVFGGTTNADARHLLCMIAYYDHATGKVPKPVVVHDKQGVDDPHDNPSLAIDDDGHLWVFVSGRGKVRPGFKYRSRKLLSINAGFDLVTEEEMTYPQPHFVPRHGWVHLFTKYTGLRELYWETSDDGVTWSPDRKLAGIREPGDSRGGHYQTSARFGKRIGTFFNRHPAGNVDRRTDLYYVQTDDLGKSWQTVDGRELSTPLAEVNSPARVIDYASQGRNVYLKDMDFDASGNPVLLYVTSAGHEPGPPNDPRKLHVVRWDGGRWIDSTICSTDHNYDMGSLYLEVDAWRVYIPAVKGPQPYHGGGELAIWQSTDQGHSWEKSQQITRGSPRNHNYARRPIGATDPFFAFWSDGDPTELSRCYLYFADSTGTQVFRLPYEMKEQFATPEPLAGSNNAGQTDPPKPLTVHQSSLVVRKVDGPPSGPSVRIQQTQRDETGPTSFRYYAPRTGPPTKTNTLAYDPAPDRDDKAVREVSEAHYYYRDRDLGQTFTTGDTGFKLGAVTVRLQPVDVKGGGDPGGARVALQLMKVTGTPRINANSTNTGNPRWATYAFTWPDDPNDENTPNRRPFKHYSDDYIEGERYEHLLLASGGIIPDDLETNDYLRWEVHGESQYELEPNTTYAFMLLFEEPAQAGVRRNIPLSNKNVLPGGKQADPFPNGHMIRRDGSSTGFDEVFIRDLNDPQDVEASRRSSAFPSSLGDRLRIPPGTLGYPDVDTYRDLYFIIEAAK